MDAKRSEKNKTQEAALEEQNAEVPTTSEDNRYVFVLNDDGQHVIKRASEVEEANERNLSECAIDEDEEDTNDSEDFMQSLWSQETDDEMVYKETNPKINKIVSNATQSTNLWKEIANNKDDSQLSDDSISKQFVEREVNNEFTSSLWNETSDRKTSNENQKNEVRDFFSMVLSPLGNGMPSPSTEMEHLRLSSPVNNNENSSEATDCFPLINNNVNAVEVDDNNAGETFTDNANLSTLQTINEDSLKELLNSITDK